MSCTTANMCFKPLNDELSITAESGRRVKRRNTLMSPSPAFLSPVRQRKGQPGKVIGYSHHHHHHLHPQHQYHHHRNHTVTHTQFIRSQSGFWQPSARRRRRAESQHWQGEGKRWSSTTGTLSKHLRLRWKSRASPAKRRSPFSQDQTSQRRSDRRDDPLICGREENDQVTCFGLKTTKNKTTISTAAA